MTAHGKHRHKLYWPQEDRLADHFPKVDTALQEPNGLLAIGGDLDPARLIEAYQQGIFPWFEQDQPILWWSPDPRCILMPDDFKPSRSLSKTLRKKKFTVTFNRVFEQVIHACAKPRKKAHGTWLSPQMIQAYCTLHKMGYAQSVETWYNNELSGGLYGINLGPIFFGESMFSRVTDASKVALSHLVAEMKKQGLGLIDCQLHSRHLQGLGATLIPRRRFIQYLKAGGYAAGFKPPTVPADL